MFDVMNLPERHFAVILYGRRVGTLVQKGDYLRFVVESDYVRDPRRPVLGLRFEENLAKPYSSALRLPPWFSNLLPEGPLRRIVADAGHVSADREMEVISQVGHDLPGAVQIVPSDEVSTDGSWEGDVSPLPSGSQRQPEPWRFSLAGVAVKLSMLRVGDRLTVPAYGARGDWIVKLPDVLFPGVPQNEYAMAKFATAVGIDVPDVKLVHRDELPEIPDRLWPGDEEWVYAIKRFDRAADERRTPIHIEDFAQVLDRYPNQKYAGNYETSAAFVYRGVHTPDLREFARRLVFMVLIGNGDAHLKNWSLIYPDRLTARLAPAYDLVTTFLYRDPDDGPEDMALKLAGDRRFEKVSSTSFVRLERRLDDRLGRSDADLKSVVEETVQRAQQALPEILGLLEGRPEQVNMLREWFALRIRQFV